MVERLDKRRGFRGDPIEDSADTADQTDQSVEDYQTMSQWMKTAAEGVENGGAVLFLSRGLFFVFFVENNLIDIHDRSILPFLSPTTLNRPVP